MSTPRIRFVPALDEDLDDEIRRRLARLEVELPQKVVDTLEALVRRYPPSVISFSTVAEARRQRLTEPRSYFSMK